MKRFAFRLLISITAFAGGLGSTALWGLYSPPALETVTRNRDYYVGKQIRVRAILDLNDLHSDVSRFDLLGPCEQEECGAWVQFDEDVRAAGLQLYHLQVVRGAELAPQKVRFADVAISGIMDPDDGMPHCNSAEYQISHARIERVYQTYEFESMEAAIAWLKNNSH
jgi:hypothetical protein